MTRTTAILAGLTALLTVADKAKAHDWYDWTCCNTKDCAPVVSEYVHITEDGFRLVMPEDGHHYSPEGGLDFTFHYGDKRIRQSQDQDYHLCLNTMGKPLCLYVPFQGA